MIFSLDCAGAIALTMQLLVHAGIDAKTVFLMFLP
jgi:hypothetical protein